MADTSNDIKKQSRVPMAEQVTSVGMWCVGVMCIAACVFSVAIGNVPMAMSISMTCCSCVSTVYVLMVTGLHNIAGGDGVPPLHVFIRSFPILLGVGGDRVRAP